MSILLPQVGCCAPEHHCHSTLPEEEHNQDADRVCVLRKLAFELREMFWKFALPGFRVAVSKTCKSIPQVKTNAKGILPTPLMHTCHESRQHALQRYKPPFSVFLEGNKGHLFRLGAGLPAVQGNSRVQIFLRCFSPL